MNKHQLERFCQQIRENEVREFNLTRLDRFAFVSLGWEDPIIEAMSTNTSVSRVTIDLSGTTCHFDYRRLLPYLRTSQHLKCLKLKPGRGGRYSSLIQRILKAVHQNCGVELELESVNEHLASVVPALQTFRTLKLSENFTQSTAFEIGQALQRNARLDSLTLYLQLNDNQGAILQQLKNHSTLKSLSLYGRKSATFPEALSSLVSSTTSLQILRLNDWYFTDETMQQAVTALRANQSIVDLSLNSCTLTRNAASQWVQFMQSGDASSIRRLTLSLADCRLPHSERVEFLASPSLLPSLEILRLPRLRLYDAGGVLVAIGGHACKARLQHLDLGDNDWYGNMAPLATFLIKAVYLVELTVSRLHTTNIAVLLSALKENGSLTRVTLTGGRGGPFLKAHSKEAKRVAAYCQRNAAMALFLTKMRLGQPVEVDATTAYLALPRLVVAVQQAPETAPNSILKAMHALEGDRIGSRSRDGKRAALV